MNGYSVQELLTNMQPEICVLSGIMSNNTVPPLPDTRTLLSIVTIRIFIIAKQDQVI